jgi:ferredoxin
MTETNTTGYYQVHLADTGESYLCAANRTLLNAMVALGRRGIPSGCHGGGCGVCKVHILQGEVATLAMSRAHVSKEDEAIGCVLACRTYPLSDVVLKVVGGMRKGVVCRYGFV